MAPPGGQSQINIFGGTEAAAPHRVSQAQQHRNQSNIFGGAPEQKPAPTPAAAAPAAAPVAQQSKTKAEPTSITAPPENPTAPGGGRASTKVMAPPGGKSSINLFG